MLLVLLLIARKASWYPFIVAGILGGFLTIPLAVIETANDEGLFQAVRAFFVYTAYYAVLTAIALAPLAIPLIIMTIVGVT